MIGFINAVQYTNIKDTTKIHLVEALNSGITLRIFKVAVIISEMRIHTMNIRTAN